MNKVSVTLEEMLEAREKRTAKISSLISDYSKTVVCMTVNLIGEYKLLPCSTAAFTYFRKRILNEYPVVYHVFSHENTGDTAYFVIDGDASSIKQGMCELEDIGEIGRLLDIDVISGTGEKLSRSIPRKCLLCDNAAAACARNRTHGVAAVREKTAAILSSFIGDKLEEMCLSALVDELNTTPKPGLVDKNNNGAHVDMCYDTFIASTNALKGYFSAVSEIVFSNANESVNKVMPLLVEAGIQAEKAMLAATNGINTHKGAIFALGLLTAGVTHAAMNDESIDSAFLYARSLAHAKQGTSINVSDNNESHGVLVRRKYGVNGATGEAMNGFINVRFSLIQIDKYSRLCDNKNDVYVNTLLELLVRLKDTNILYRGGISGQELVTEGAKRVLRAGIADRIEQAKEFDNELIHSNLSPGGAADILAAAIFIHNSMELFAK